MNAQLASKETASAGFKKTGGSPAGKSPAAGPPWFCQTRPGRKTAFCQTEPPSGPPQMDRTRPPAFPYPSSPFTIHNSLFPIPPLRIPAMVGYGKLWKVMEGYGNFPASARPCRAEARRRRIPPFQPLAFSLQHLPSPRRSNPVKPSQTMFLGWTATKDRSAPSKNRSFSRRFFQPAFSPFGSRLSTLDPRLCLRLRRSAFLCDK